MASSLPPATPSPLRICALAGGVGGARLAHGLQQLPAPGSLSVIVNTGDDFDHLGLRICCDLDTVMYTLGGVADAAQGWGLAGDTRQAMDMVARYGGPSWFTLGDKDLGTHLVRTQLLARRERLTHVTHTLCQGLGIRSQILPMCDAPVATRIRTQAGETLDFQTWFVGRRHADPVAAVEFAGIERASATPEASSALGSADVVVLCPSNPFVSLAPILAIPAYRRGLETASVPRVAVSPIIGGAAVKGPAAAMLASLGHEVSSVGIAHLYRGLIDVLVIDDQDRSLAPRIAELGIHPVVVPTLMSSEADRASLASHVLEAAASWRRQRAPAATAQATPTAAAAAPPQGAP
jgi:LPPG:FO 2-phospho-L-lactate transferase